MMEKNSKFIKRCSLILAVLFIFTFLAACSSDVHAHVYGEWEIDTPATCEEEGLRYRTCSICGSVEEDVIPALGHIVEYDEPKMPTLTETGLTAGAHCKRCGEVFVEQVELEKLREVDFGYPVYFGTDEHVEIYVYETQDYEAEPVKSNVAYARDSETGELLKNGKGQVNFELRFEDGYYLKNMLVSPQSGYNAIKGESDTHKENVYRITKITEDLVVYVTSQKPIEIEDFASVTDDDGVVYFSWKRDSRIDKIGINVTTDDDTLEYELDGWQSSWSYELDENKYYKFEFTPYDESGAASTTYKCTRYYNPSAKEVAFPRVEITTQGGVFPSRDFALPPPGCMGLDIINNDYVQCIVDIFDSNNDSVYTSSTESDFSSAKIKIRGNSSANTEKTPYKIKLSKKADLLSPFVPDRTDKSYADKEWVLLKTGYSIAQIIGTSIAETVQMEYVPEYTYCVLYLNGDYRGIYILTEAVNQGNGAGEKQSRCAVDDDGYIVELDVYWWSEDVWFSTLLTAYEIRYTFKYPDADDLTMESAELDYIKNYIIRAEETLLSGSESYTDYLDVASFAKWILGHDLLGTYDAAGTNMYVLKQDSTDESKLRMAVLWDFDSICDWRFVESLAYIRTKPYFFFSTLEKNDRFLEEYSKLYDRVKDSVITNLENKLSEMDVDSYDELIAVEKVRWPYFQSADFDTQKDDAMLWLTSHLSWMDEHFSEGQGD